MAMTLTQIAIAIVMVCGLSVGVWGVVATLISDSKERKASEENE